MLGKDNQRQSLSQAQQPFSLQSLCAVYEINQTDTLLPTSGHKSCCWIVFKHFNFRLVHGAISVQAKANVGLAIADYTNRIRGGDKTY